MCTALWIAKGWWSVAGLIIEFIGFAYLLRTTIFEVVMKHHDLVFHDRFDIGKLESEGQKRAGILVWQALQRPALKRLYFGGAIILLSLLLQVVGSWALLTRNPDLHCSA